MVSITSNFKEFKENALFRMTESANYVKYALKEYIKSDFVREWKNFEKELYMNPLDTPERFTSQFGYPLYEFDESVKYDNVGTENDMRIILEGDGIYFIEFGTGVRLNNFESFAGNVSMEMGSYGAHQGLNDLWSYTYRGKTYVTRGTYAQRPFFGTMKLIDYHMPQLFSKAVKNLH